MTVRELKLVTHKKAVIELANAKHYYTGRVENIPKELLNMTVTYIATGPIGTVYGDRFNKEYDSGTMLLVDAE